MCEYLFSFQGCSLKDNEWLNAFICLCGLYVSVWICLYVNTFLHCNLTYGWLSWEPTYFIYIFLVLTNSSSLCKFADEFSRVLWSSLIILRGCYLQDILLINGEYILLLEETRFVVLMLGYDISHTKLINFYPAISLVEGKLSFYRLRKVLILLNYDGHLSKVCISG